MALLDRTARPFLRSQTLVAAANRGAVHTSPPCRATNSSYAAICTADARLSEA